MDAGVAELAVTTCRNPTPVERERAEHVARFIGHELLERRALSDLFAVQGLEHIYVVGRKRERLVDAAGAELFVHEGLMRSKAQHGEPHPFLQAVRGGDAEPPAVVFDATAGLCGDGLHLAAAWPQTRIVAAERSRVVFCLIEAGLGFLRASRTTAGGAPHPAGRLSVRHGPALKVLEQHVARSELNRVDVVIVDPMFERATRAAPGYQLFRAVADPRPLEPDALRGLARRARRVVFKLRSGWRTEPQGLTWHRRVQGSANDFLVHESDDFPSPER